MGGRKNGLPTNGVWGFAPAVGRQVAVGVWGYLVVPVEFHLRSDLVASVRPSARRHLCIARPRAATAGSPAPTRVVLGQERLETVLMEPSSTVLNKA